MCDLCVIFVRRWILPRLVKGSGSVIRVSRRVYVCLCRGLIGLVGYIDRQMAVWVLGRSRVGSAMSRNAW